VDETSKSREARVGEKYRDATPEDRKKLGIAPSYKNVKVTDDPKAEKLWTATHTTPAGKEVSKAGYSKQYQQENEAAKWKRIEALHKDFPALEKRIHDDIKKGGEDAEKALTLRTINRTGLRNGGEKGGGRVKAYGASSLLTSHATTEGDKVHLDFIGKEGIRQQHSFTDKDVAEHIRNQQAAGKDKIFSHDDAGTRAYLDKISGGKYKVHDLRTYHGTALASHLAAKRGGLPSNPKEFKAAQKEIATHVSKELGNEPEMALKNYIHPGVWHE
jgi:DNA topoisomerase-1